MACSIWLSGARHLGNVLAVPTGRRNETDVMEHDAHDDPIEFHTAHGVRLRRTSRTPGPWNWLFLPGGPGIGS